MKRGIFVSRKDSLPNGDIVTTFDIRMKEPNREPVVHQDALHTIEHLAATFLRNHPVWKNKVIYWGPMGCCTGNYLILEGNLESTDIVELMKETFEFISNFDPMYFVYGVIMTVIPMFIGYFFAILGSIIGLIIAIYLITRKDPSAKKHGYTSVCPCFFTSLRRKISNPKLLRT